MEFKKTYKETDTGCQRNIYYYVDNKRVSCDKYYDKEVLCQVKGMRYNSSYLYNNKGRIVVVHHYN